MASLQNNHNKYPALIPPMQWLDTIPPGKPFVKFESGNSYCNAFVLNIDVPKHLSRIKTFIIYAFDINDHVRNLKDPDNILKVVPSSAGPKIVFPQLENQNKLIAVSCIDVNDNESELTFF